MKLPPRSRNITDLALLARDLHLGRVFLVEPSLDTLDLIQDSFALYRFMKRRDVLKELVNVGAVYQHMEKGAPNIGGPLFLTAELLNIPDYTFVKNLDTITL